jgi:hypothetical protein
METDSVEYESIYYFLKYTGNEENIQHLQKQLESIDWYIIDNYSTFDIDTTHLVSAQTAKEMSKLELNVDFHRKFDGTLSRVDLKIKPNDKTKHKIKQVNKILRDGGIAEFIDQEDVDEEDLVSRSSDSSDSDSGSEESDSSSGSSDSSSEEESDHEVKPKKKIRGVPPAVLLRRKNK